MSTCSASRYVSDLVDIVSRSTSTDVWNPVTRPINSTLLRHVRLAVWLLARANTKVKVGIEASNDGITWPDGPKVLSTSYVNQDGWTFGPTWFDLEGVTGLNQRNFFRLGVFAANTTGADCNSAQCRLSLESQPLRFDDVGLMAFGRSPAAPHTYHFGDPYQTIPTRLLCDAEQDLVLRAYRLLQRQADLVKYAICHMVTDGILDPHVTDNRPAEKLYQDLINSRLDTMVFDTEDTLNTIAVAVSQPASEKEAPTIAITSTPTPTSTRMTRPATTMPGEAVAPAMACELTMDDGYESRTTSR